MPLLKEVKRIITLSELDVKTFYNSKRFHGKFIEFVANANDFFAADKPLWNRQN